MGNDTASNKTFVKSYFYHHPWQSTSPDKKSERRTEGRTDKRMDGQTRANLKACPHLRVGGIINQTNKQQQKQVNELFVWHF